MHALTVLLASLAATGTLAAWIFLLQIALKRSKLLATMKRTLRLTWVGCFLINAFITSTWAGLKVRDFLKLHAL